MSFRAFPRLVSLLSVGALLFVMGCGETPDPEDTTTELDDPIGMEDPNQIDPDGDAQDEDDTTSEEDATVDFSRETTLAMSPSVLEDDTGYGFAYDSSNALDLDYSTAWCHGDSEAAPILTLSFPGEVDLGTFGIVPGFARDETIYYQNNRVKSVEYYLNGEPEATGEFTLDDVYEMQFVDLDLEDVTQIAFHVVQVYAGSKYDDTCIAEVDFWSEWVDTKDADAAYNYYQQYKADAALRPVGIDALTVSLGADVMNSCGQIDESVLFDSSSTANSIDYYWKGSGDYVYSYVHTLAPHNNGTLVHNYTFAQWGSHPIVVSVDVNEWAELGDVLTAKFVKIPVSMEDGSQGVGAVTSIKTATVLSCPDGGLHASVAFEASDYSSGGSCVFGDCEVQFYYGDRLIGVTPDIQFTQ